MKLMLALHLTSLVLWMSGLLLVSSQLRNALRHSIATNVVKLIIAPLTKIFMLLGMLLTLATGVIQLFIRGFDFYLRQGWFHAKLTLIIVLVVMTLMLYDKVRQYLNNQRPSEKSLLVIHIVSATSMLLIFIFTAFKF